MKNNRISTLIITLVLLNACSSETNPSKTLITTENLNASSLDAGNSSPPTVDPLEYHAYNINLYPRNKLVCDPFAETRTTEIEYGIKANLFYMPTGLTNYSKVDDYIEKGIASESPLFFTDLYVPTRKFDQGFSTSSGDLLRDNANNTLIEYFGIEFTSQLALPAELEEGDYDLATLADDGSIVRIQVNNQWVTLINNDGLHPTRMGCATSSLHLDHTSLIPLQVRYYQGPRYHISHSLLWRKVTSHQTDPLCGQQGNNYFFDPDHNSAPLQHYKDLLSRDWTPVPPHAFVLNQQQDYNPCVQSEVPDIQNFAVDMMEYEFVTMKWTTDILATSQLEITDLGTGEVTLTLSDNALRLNQYVFIYNLVPGHSYSVRAISVGKALGQSISDPVEFTYSY